MAKGFRPLGAFKILVVKIDRAGTRIIGDSHVVAAQRQHASRVSDKWMQAHNAGSAAVIPTTMLNHI